MFGITLDKILIIGLLAAFLLGPDKLPIYAQKLANLVKTVRGMTKDATGKLKNDLGPEFDEMDWRKLDPRQYDPRRIIKDALLDDSPIQKNTPPTSVGATVPPIVIGQTISHEQRALTQQRLRGEATTIVPFDNEST